jgi:hypothetical protein
MRQNRPAATTSPIHARRIRCGFLLAGIASAGLGLLALAAAAQAADVGQCGPPDQMSALLKAEGQRSLAHGNQQIRAERLPDGELRAVRKQVGLIFTADADGKVGYMLQASQPIGTRAEKICVAERFHNIRLYDVRKPGLPREALLNSTEADAARRCDELAARMVVARGSCGFLNAILQRTEPLGERLMLMGLGVKRQADGSWQPDGTLVTVTANMTGDRTERDGRGALQYTTLPDGATIVARVFTGSSYTDAAQQMFAGQR